MHRIFLAFAAALALGLAGQALAQPAGSRPSAQPGATQPRSSAPPVSPAPAPPAPGGQAQEGQAQGDLTAPDDHSPEMNHRQLSDADRGFLLHAYSGARSEVQLGQLAVQKGTSIRAKQFGTRLATDHDQASQELSQIASEAEVELPTEPERSAMGTYQRLRGISGSDFDAAFAQAVVQAHQRDIIAFRQQAKSGKDPALKDFAQKYLPTLQQHLQLARGLLAPTS